MSKTYNGIYTSTNSRSEIFILRGIKTADQRLEYKAYLTRASINKWRSQNINYGSSIEIETLINLDDNTFIMISTYVNERGKHMTIAHTDNNE